MIVIELSGPPRGKERVKRAQAGHSYTPERTVNFESRMALAAQTAMQGRPPMEGPLHLEVIMRFPVPLSWPKKRRADALAGRVMPTVKPDWDNGGKLTDALNQIVWVDDKQIVRALVEKFYSTHPGTTVRVSPAEGIFS